MQAGEERGRRGKVKKREEEGNEGEGGNGFEEGGKVPEDRKGRGEEGADGRGRYNVQPTF